MTATIMASYRGFTSTSLISLSMTLFSSLLTLASSHPEFRIGYIPSRAEFSVPSVTQGPAIQMAVEAFKSQGYLINYNFSVSWRLVGSYGPKSGVSAALRLVLEDDVDCVIGPLASDTCLPVAYQMTHWNIPYYGNACTDSALDNKTIFDTFVRVMSSNSKFSGVCVEIMKYYNWERAVIISEDTRQTCTYAANAIQNDLYVNNFTVAEWIKIPIMKVVTEDVIDDFLNRIKNRGRIVFMCVGGPHTQSLLVSRAQKLGMTNGDYVFLYVSLTENSMLSDAHQMPSDEWEKLKPAYYAFKIITMEYLGLPLLDQFREKVRRRNENPPWYIKPTPGLQSPIYSAFTYDATYLYLLLVNETLAEGLDPRDGRLMFKKARNKRFYGITGNVVMDDKCDRSPDFTIWHFAPGLADFVPFSHVRMNNPTHQRMQMVAKPFWGSGKMRHPPDSPTCGFHNELCPEDTSTRDLIITIMLAFTMCVVLCIVGIVYYKKRKRLEEELQHVWKVEYEDLEFITTTMGSIPDSSLTVRSMSYTSSNSMHRIYDFTKLALYRGNMVAVKKVNKPTVNLTRHDLHILKAMKDMNHEKINLFIGACVKPNNICILWLYCSKGSLQDILANDDIKLDWVFKTSLITDLVQGMGYLHGTLLHSHGNLKSSTCLVDSRWVLKVSDFGRYAITQNETTEVGHYEKYRELFWTAPELLRMSRRRPEGTQAGDVYSIGIILHEIVNRSLSFSMDEFSPEDIIKRITHVEDPPYRPVISHEVKTSCMAKLMKDCWEENPEARPSLSGIRKTLRMINTGRKVNIMDNMIQMLEKYASNLEEIVQQRTRELSEEKKKTETLLYRMLPRMIADQLKCGKQVEPELFGSVSIYFSDIVGFTSLAADSTPMEVVDLLNDLYTMFDGTIDKHDVYKVETIGDAYMVVSGVPQRNGERHVTEIANMALDVLSETVHFKIRHRPNANLKLRVGVHTGPCVAGVVGQTMPRYCLFGDTVNMASRMESTGEALKIHLSEPAFEALNRFAVYKLEPRGHIEVKGKGLQMTYWLLGKEGLCASLDVPMKK